MGSNSENGEQTNSTQYLRKQNESTSVGGNCDLITITDMAVNEFRSTSKTLKSKFMNQMECRLSEIIDDVAQAFAKSSIDSTKAFLVSDSMQVVQNHGGSDELRRQSVERSETANENKKPSKPKLPDKEFQLRQSPLTELLEVPHFRTIHHIFIASLILMFLHTMLQDLSETGGIDLGLDGLLWAFGEPSKALKIILVEYFLAICIVYPAFNYWTSRRGQYKTKQAQGIFDKIAAGAFAVFFTGFICIPGVMLWKKPLPFASALVVTLEQARLLMKMYAFVRSNVPKALAFKNVSTFHSTTPIHTLRPKNKSELLKNPNHSEAETDASSTTVQLRKNVSQGNNTENNSNQIQIQNQENNNEKSRRSLNRYESWLSWESEASISPCPDFTKYLYFLFAPTLIYRDHYPRTNRIRWNYVCWNFAQCVGCLFYANFVLNRFCSSKFANLGLKGSQMNLKELLQSLFALMLPGTINLVLTFFTILHAWQNAFAEMLYFGDRMFYKDWWNCSSFAVYYKTWNILVHDWLYTYIFKDAWESGLGQKFKALPTLLVFIISSLFHEYILSVSFHFFFPVVLVLFGGFGFIFIFVGDRKKNSAVGNVLMWMALMSGTGIIIAAYSMELYVRINCPATSESSFFVPRIIACDVIKFTWN